MLTKCDYLDMISRRGDPYGGHGGILDLLQWCSKPNTQLVTLEEARRYYENPASEYPPAGLENAPSPDARGCDSPLV